MVSFQGKYQILSALADGESQSFRALQISSGRPVLVHHLAAGRTSSQQPDLGALIFRFLRSASEEECRHFLDMGEDEGRVFVVTADVPECQDLRQWLQSVTDAHVGTEGGAQPAEGTPGPGSFDSTRKFTTKALREVSRSPASASVPPSAGPRAAQPAVPTPEKSPGVLKPTPEIPASSSEVTDSGATDFTAFWEKSSRASLAGHPASIPTPPTSLKSADGPSEVPEVTAEFLSGRSSLSVNDAPTAAMTTLQAQAADRERAPAAVAGAPLVKGKVGQFADLILTPPEGINPPAAASVGEVSIGLPQPAVTPAAKGPETEIPRVFTGLLVENAKALPQVAVSASTPGADDKQEAEIKLAPKVPRPQIPMGFEVVFQSSKPHSRPTLSGLPEQSGIMAAPAPIALQTGLEKSAPTPVAAGLPNVSPPVVSPPAEKMGGNPALGIAQGPGWQRQDVGARNEPSAPPLPLLPPQALKQSEPATRLVLTPPALPGGSASTGGATPPTSAPMPTPPNRAQPGEYTRMIENLKVAAGPLPPGVPPAGYRPAANPLVPAPTPSPASYLPVPASQPAPYPEAPRQYEPSLYLAHDPPSPSAGKKRPGWVPILILSSLFLITVALLLFFAFKH